MPNFVLFSILIVLNPDAEKNLKTTKNPAKFKIYSNHLTLPPGEEGTLQNGASVWGRESIKPADYREDDGIVWPGLSWSSTFATADYMELLQFIEQCTV